MKRLIMIVLMIMLLGISLQAEADLTVLGTDDINGNQLIYDSDLDITWYDYTNGATTYENQMNWADGLSLTFGGETYGDWRLPTTFDDGSAYVFGSDGTTSGGYNITSGELGYLFYEGLGNKGYIAQDGTNPQPGWGLSNSSHFDNLYGTFYWTGTEYSANAPHDVWEFNMSYGLKYAVGKSAVYSGIAVADGNIGVPVVPEPISYVLFLSGGAILGLRRFRKKQISV